MFDNIILTMIYLARQAFSIALFYQCEPNDRYYYLNNVIKEHAVFLTQAPVFSFATSVKDDIHCLQAW